MNKDRNGTMAVWLVTIENKSSQYSYSKISYETTYVGADNTAILINKGTIPATIGPANREIPKSMTRSTRRARRGTEFESLARLPRLNSREFVSNRERWPLP